MGTLEALNEDELADLVAMTWIGRGDFTRDDWEDAKDQARERGVKGTAEYLLGTPLLGDYLENAFNDSAIPARTSKPSIFRASISLWKRVGGKTLTCPSPYGRGNAVAPNHSNSVPRSTRVLALAVGKGLG
jgi:hypothetical protein